MDAYYGIFEQDSIVYSRPDDANLPLTVSGTLNGGNYILDGGVSSQYITGLLFALPLLRIDSTITVTGKFESRGYVDLTISLLSTFGINIICKDNKYFIKGGQRYTTAAIYRRRGTIHRPHFFIVGGAIAGDIRIDGLAENSLQPDNVIVDIMQRMGASIVRNGNGLRIRKIRHFPVQRLTFHNAPISCRRWPSPQPLPAAQRTSQAPRGCASKKATALPQ